MPTADGPDGPVHERRRLPIFDIPQREGTSVMLDFTTPGPFGDLAFTARVPQADGTVRERIYGSYHVDEAAIFVEILQHWARVAHSDDILAGLDRAASVLRFLATDLEATTQSENDFGELLHRGIEPLAAIDFLPTDHEHSDERGEVIVLAPRGTDLHWISRHNPLTTFSVPPSHLWIFVTGMMWRTYDNDSIPLSRLNTVEYESATASFRAAISLRRETPAHFESLEAAVGEGQDEVRMPSHELVQRLGELLGAKLVAYLASVQYTRTVREWADPATGRTPPSEVVDRLRLALRVATLLRTKDSSAVIQAWFQGRNPLLDDVAPARLLREGTADIAGPSVLAAARAFAAEP